MKPEHVLPTIACLLACAMAQGANPLSQPMEVASHSETERAVNEEKAERELRMKRIPKEEAAKERQREAQRRRKTESGSKHMDPPPPILPGGPGIEPDVPWPRTR
jgi:hypothetical protein